MTIGTRNIRTPRGTAVSCNAQEAAALRPAEPTDNLDPAVTKNGTWMRRRVARSIALNNDATRGMSLADPTVLAHNPIGSSRRTSRAGLALDTFSEDDASLPSNPLAHERGTFEGSCVRVEQRERAAARAADAVGRAQ